MRGELALLARQLRQIAPAAGVLALLLAALAAIVPESISNSGLSLLPFTVAMGLGIVLNAPRHPGATAHLMLCGFSRAQVWRQTAIAAILAGATCGAGAALGASGPVRAAAETALGLTGDDRRAALLFSQLGAVGLGAAGAAVGLWIGSALLQAGPRRRLRASVRVVAVAAGMAGLASLTVQLTHGSRAEAIVLLGAVGAAAAFLWLSRNQYLRMEPLRD